MPYRYSRRRRQYGSRKRSYGGRSLYNRNATRIQRNRAQAGNTRTGGNLNRYTPQANFYPEMKHYDFVHSGTAIPIPTGTNTASQTWPQGVIQGTDANTRIGNKITCRNMTIRGELLIKASPPDLINNISNTTDCVVRVMIVIDHQTNGVAMQWNDFMSVVNVHAMPNLRNKWRYSILKDMTVSANRPLVGGDTNAAPYALSIPIYIDQPLLQRCNFKSNGGTISDLADNSVHFFVVLNNSVSFLGEFWGLTRLQYTDT